ncbi:MAG: hypothetical protein GYB68_16340, partial [Chloroflexi bacterium]|nr:hypothetical protein [Chloroflexota bacterium]
MCIRDRPTPRIQGGANPPGGAAVPPHQQTTRPSPRPQMPPPPPPQPQVQPRGQQPPPQAVRPQRRQRPQSRRRPFITTGCILRFVGISLIGVMVAMVFGAAGSAIYYSQVTAPVFRDIQDFEDLQARALQFETTRIRDAEGNILYQINAPEGGLRDYVEIEEISPYIIHATVSTEEREYFTNPGFSIPGIIRAVYQNVQEGAIVSGASTITQQLTRALLLPEEERTERSIERKIREIFLAAELGRRFSKEEILELYLNQNFYGNFAYGIEAAADTYFETDASGLTLAQAAYLAGIPQAPAVWDPVRAPEDALLRQTQVLSLMLEAECINTGRTSIQLPCVTVQDVEAARPELQQIAETQFEAPQLAASYPHWVVYIQQQLEADPALGPALYTSGFDVYTTLDPRLQDLAQQQVNATIDALAGQNVTNASVIIIDPDTGAILAMVGSRDFNSEAIDGQVNIALTLQQPGSSIKPFTFLAAFRRGWTPATVLWDVPIEYAIPGFGVYAPVNYDGRYRGPVSVRSSIANSYNIPSVLALDFVGVPDLLRLLNQVGITSLGDETNPNQYGLSLTLGAGEVYLLEWTNAFATLANGGTYRPTYAIERIEIDGEVLEGWPYQVPEGQQVLDPTLTYLMQDIMSDDEARVPAFGFNSPLSRPYTAAAKTGTTDDFRDNWTMGYTTELAVGVWVGNTDNSPMLGVSGVTGAGPIWQGIMDGSQQWYPAQPFERPAGVFDQTVCRDDGTIPSAFCIDLPIEPTTTEVFSPVAPPPDTDESIYQELQIDTFTGLIANEFCPNFNETQVFFSLPNPSQTIDVPEFARDWLLNTEPGRNWLNSRNLTPDRIDFEGAPFEACGPDTPVPELFISNPASGSQVTGVVEVRGSANVPNFDRYILDFGLGADPQGWGRVLESNDPIVDGEIARIDLSNFQAGQITLRLIVLDTAGNAAETQVTFDVLAPTPTPTPTPTQTPEDAEETETDEGTPTPEP